MTDKVKIIELADGRFLLENEDKKLLGLRGRDTVARILFTDYDSDLIRAAEAKAAALGKKTIKCNYADRYNELTKLFEENGYEVRQSKSILAVNIRDILSSKEARKAMTIDFTGTEWIPFRDLLAYQFEELMSLIRLEGIPISREELARFDEDLSGIIYDANKKVSAFILSVTQGEEILVEGLYGTRKDNPMYIMAALRGFATEIYNCDMEEIYQRISMIEINQKVSRILKKLMDEDFEILEEGKVIHARKVLAEPDEADLPVSIESNAIAQFSALRLMTDRLERQRFQNNINWKSGLNQQS